MTGQRGQRRQRGQRGQRRQRGQRGQRRQRGQRTQPEAGAAIPSGHIINVNVI
jgi:hypothetical protein